VERLAHQRAEAMLDDWFAASAADFKAMMEAMDDDDRVSRGGEEADADPRGVDAG